MPDRDVYGIVKPFLQRPNDVHAPRHPSDVCIENLIILGEQTLNGDPADQDAVVAHAHFDDASTIPQMRQNADGTIMWEESGPVLYLSCQ